MKKFSYFFVVASLIFFGISQSCTRKEYIEVAPQLRIIVRNDTNALVKGASVYLFSTEPDFFKQTNVISSMQTDSTGGCLFKELKSNSYYFYVEFEGASNMWSTNFVDSLAAGNRLIVNTTIYSKNVE